MHTPSLYSFIASRKFIPVLVALVLVLAIFFYGIEMQSSQLTRQVLPSPTPVAANWSVQTNTNQRYILQYPSTWQAISDSTNQSTTYVYTDQGKQYKFTVSPPGQVNPEGVANPTIEKQEVTYAGRKYLKELWKDGNTPFYVVAIPEDITSDSHFFSMQLPRDNPSTYINTFDKIMSTLKE